MGLEQMNDRIQVEHNRASYLEGMKAFHKGRINLERKLIKTEHQDNRNDLDDKNVVRWTIIRHTPELYDKYKVNPITK